MITLKAVNDLFACWRFFLLQLNSRLQNTLITTKYHQYHLCRADLNLKRSSEGSVWLNPLCGVGSRRSSNENRILSKISMNKSPVRLKLVLCCLTRRRQDASYQSVWQIVGHECSLSGYWDYLNAVLGIPITVNCLEQIVLRLRTFNSFAQSSRESICDYK